jgi:hypothetical protein
MVLAQDGDRFAREPAVRAGQDRRGLQAREATEGAAGEGGRGARPNFGFGYNAGRDNYVVDEGQMRIIRRIFREVGAEGRTMYTVKAALDREGVVAPSGGRFWSLKFLRDRINTTCTGPTPSRTGEELAVRHALTTVRMRAFGEEELEAYARLGEGVGKAGGYALQGRAAAFVEWIGGDYTNVVGLPLALTVRMLAGFGINWY